METVVVVDDDRVFCELLKTVLDLEGYRAAPCTCPNEVISTVLEEDPALVLMDIHMRDQDTLEALRELKNDEYLRDIPVIMTSGMDRGAECIEAGADDFVLKPFRPAEMLARIQTLIRSRP